jgi:hypothetical protein
MSRVTCKTRVTRKCAEKELDQMYITALPYSLRGKFDQNESIRLGNLFCCVIGSLVVLF